MTQDSSLRKVCSGPLLERLPLKWPKIVKSLCKQYASTEKNVEVPQKFMAFLRTIVIALTIHVRIMRICCCPMQIFSINCKGYS